MEKMAAKKTIRKIKPFTGNKNLDEWFRKFEFLAQMNKWSRESLVTHLYENLGGAAKEWFKYLPRNILQNYNEVLQRLRENF